MQAHNWNQFNLRVPIKATTGEIFQKWVSQEGLESWFLRKAAFTKKDGSARSRESMIEKEDSYEWLWHGWSDEVVERGTVLEQNNKNDLAFTFGKAGKVKVSVKEEKGESILELKQFDIPTDAESQVLYHIGCTKGWLFYLTNLKSILEGGIDLRNRNAELADVINS